MAKRIWGVIVLLFGVGLTVAVAVTMAYDIPSNFVVEGEGLEALVNLVEKYGLEQFFLFMGLGLTIALSALVMFLSPRKIKVKASIPMEGVVTAAEVAADESEDGTAPADTPYLICSYHTRLMGTAFANPGGRPRQQILSEVNPGDAAACRTVVQRAPNETETVGVFTVKGEQMGFIDLSVLRTVRERYPDHRIGVTIARISGGMGVPYTCSVRVGVYRF